MTGIVRRRLAMTLAVLASGALVSSLVGVALAQEVVREIQVEGGDFYFKPKDLTLTAGERVRIVFTNAGPIPHELEISKLGAQGVTWTTAAEVPADEKLSLDEHAGRGTPEVWLPAGTTGSVEFTPVNAGTYEMLCAIEGHAESGMVGTVTVVAAGEPAQLPKSGGAPLPLLALGAAGLGLMLGISGLVLRRQQ